MRRQLGLITRAQALSADLTERQLRLRVTRREWVEVAPGVFRHASAAADWVSQVYAAVLWAEKGIASHRSAARLWGFETFHKSSVVELSTPAAMCRPNKLWILHVRRGGLPPVARRLRGIPVTGALDTLCDLAAVVDARRLGAAMDEALRRQWVTLEDVRSRISGPRRGRRGVALLREVLDGRCEGAESVLESELWAVLQGSGLELPAAQVEVKHDGKLITRADFAYEARKLALFADGYRWHVDKARWDRDLEQQNALIALGWLVLRFNAAAIRFRPELVVSRVRQCLEGGS